VKIRGNRVEPGRSKVVILEHLAVRQAVVVRHDDPQGQARLIDAIPLTANGKLDYAAGVAGCGLRAGS
jgi:hypothetical protein